MIETKVKHLYLIVGTIVLALTLSGCSKKSLTEIHQECKINNAYMNFDMNTQQGRDAAKALYDTCVDLKVAEN